MAWGYCLSTPLRLVTIPYCWKIDRKSTRLNSSHGYISYAVFCLKKKKTPSDMNMNTANHYQPPQAHLHSRVHHIAAALSALRLTTNSPLHDSPNCIPTLRHPQLY